MLQINIHTTTIETLFKLIINQQKQMRYIYYTNIKLQSCF